MYGKFFASAFTGSMMGAGTDVFAVWGYIIANADRSGQVELNPRLLGAVLGCDPSVVRSAIDYLQKPDPESRTPIADGRRLVPMHAFWYEVVNHQLYREMRNSEERREYNRKKQSDYRASKRVNTENVQSVQSVPQCTHAEAEAEADTEVEQKQKRVPRVVVPDEHEMPAWLPLEPWEAFVRMRKKSKEPFTQDAVKLAITKLGKMAESGQDVAEVLNQSTLNGWKGLFEVKNNGKNSYNGISAGVVQQSTRLSRSQAAINAAFTERYGADAAIDPANDGSIPPPGDQSGHGGRVLDGLRGRHG